MITKNITLKFSDGTRTSVRLSASSEAEMASLVAAEMARTGAYGFGTQSTVFHPGR